MTSAPHLAVRFMSRPSGSSEPCPFPAVWSAWPVIARQGACAVAAVVRSWWCRVTCRRALAERPGRSRPAAASSDEARGMLVYVAREVAGTLADAELDAIRTGTNDGGQPIRLVLRSGGQLLPEA
jgi:hypothetical protein